MTTKFKKSFSPMLICWNDIKIHLGFEDSYFVPPPIYSNTAISWLSLNFKDVKTSSKGVWNYNL